MRRPVHLFYQRRYLILLTAMAVVAIGFATVMVGMPGLGALVAAPALPAMWWCLERRDRTCLRCLMPRVLIGVGAIGLLVWIAYATRGDTWNVARSLIYAWTGLTSISVLSFAFLKVCTHHFSVGPKPKPPTPPSRPLRKVSIIGPIWGLAIMAASELVLQNVKITSTTLNVTTNVTTPRNTTTSDNTSTLVIAREGTDRV